MASAHRDSTAATHISNIYGPSGAAGCQLPSAEMSKACERVDFLSATEVDVLSLLQQENKVEAARRVAWSIMADLKVKGAYKTGPTVKNVSTPAVALSWLHRGSLSSVSMQSGLAQP
jgi:hypothetical protein